MLDAQEPMKFPSPSVPGLGFDPLVDGLHQVDGLRRAVLPYGRPTWLVTRHEDVKAVLTDSRFSRARAVGPGEPRIVPFVQQANVLLISDGPEHVRLRQLLASAFSVRGVERLRPRTQEIVDELLDELERARPPVELVESFALTVPVLVICELLGVPPERQPRLRALADAFWVPKLAEFTDEVVDGLRRELYEYLRELVRGQRAEPGPGLLGALVRKGQATDDDLLAITVTMLVAGHEAIADQIANIVYLLLTRHELFRELRAHPESLPHAVEELLRFVPLGVGTGLPRVATEDVTVGGTLVQAGEYVLPMMSAANRDEAAFDQPDRLDITREDSGHMTFGFGAHRCLGSVLARMELQVAIGSLLRRFPALALADPVDGVRWIRGGLVRAPQTLKVTW
ncbi:hypothetical protein ALI144C_31420 [Actinosynnema sp. ALI-1.44]|uniref:cytochrome P450 n=1 Tax=Actinosynnema sp. ALI-1.44 TaxID=1933779 RepID=UPI00097C93F9|nr:cytochrome P450 [Actinosynnema sp. ALI-1.44]ONI77914.1 hypothetical protein ALI144C_31420 [Actinosynnema sp. ALI-1.44]